MTTSTLETAVSFDSTDAHKHASFWVAIAGGTIADGASAEFASIERPGEVNLNFNQVDEPKVAKNRVHLDITVEDLPTATERAVELGGTVVTEHDGWTVLQDPEGNEFCLLTA